MKLLKNLISQLLLIFLVVLSCKNDTKEKVTADEKSDTYVNLETTGTCLSDSSWFQINPNTRKRHTPAPKEDSSSVFGNNTTVSNCDFHQWSWQKFLWLTNETK